METNLHEIENMLKKANFSFLVNEEKKRRAIPSYRSFDDSFYEKNILRILDVPGAIRIMRDVRKNMDLYSFGSLCQFRKYISDLGCEAYLANPQLTAEIRQFDQESRSYLLKLINLDKLEDMEKKYMKPSEEELVELVQHPMKVKIRE